MAVASLEATQEDTTISQGDVDIAVRVAQASETFTGQFFRCNKVRHRFHDEECEMYDPEFLNTSWDLQRPARANRTLEQKAHPRPWGQRQLTKSHSPQTE